MTVKKKASADRRSKKQKGTTKTVRTVLTADEFRAAITEIKDTLEILKREMNDRFEHHQNIILAEYRHRIETLETKVRELQAMK